MLMVNIPGQPITEVDGADLPVAIQKDMVSFVFQRQHTFVLISITCTGLGNSGTAWISSDEIIAYRANGLASWAADLDAYQGRKWQL